MQQSATPPHVVLGRHQRRKLETMTLRFRDLLIEVAEHPRTEPFLRAQREDLAVQLITALDTAGFDPLWSFECGGLSLYFAVDANQTATLHHSFIPRITLAEVAHR